MSKCHHQQHWIITDVARDIDLESVVVGPLYLPGTDRPLVVRKRRLRGGLRDGVDIIELEWGSWSVSVLPTRGMGIWRAQYGSVPLRWESPVRGPVHPRFVPLYDPSGLGWLDGFDEFVVRCGLTSNGAPEFNAQGQLQYPLHGRIANQPAHDVRLSVDSENRCVTLTGVVEETRFHFQKLRLKSTLQLSYDVPTLRLHDRIENFSDAASTFQLLYHNNIGTPFLGQGSAIHAPVSELVPRNEHAATSIGRWNTFGAPESGGVERVYLMKLNADSQQRTEVVLTNPDQSQAIGLGHQIDQLPCFTLWKNEVGIADGYVTGLEPGTNFPNPHSFEGKQGRVVELQAGAAYDVHLSYNVYSNSDEVRDAIAAVQQLQGDSTRVYDRPQSDWCA